MVYAMMMSSYQIIGHRLREWPSVVYSSSSSIRKERKHLSLSLGKRRKIVVVDEEEIENAKKPMVPKNTRKATDWAVAVFKQWIEQHNAIAENKCPVDILKDEPENLTHWLCVL